jgi:hypothetical protein
MGKRGPKPRHGHAPCVAYGGVTSRLYVAWGNMKSRCYTKSHPSYKYYGERGIEVCPQWRYDFEAFMRDVGQHPGKGWTLDRIDPYKDYEPGNVRWATPKTQARHRTDTRLTAAQVAAIRQEYVPYKITGKILAAKYGISITQVLHITRGERWQ